ncbi:hypothetical protein FXN63_10515 [Pigmentiphaga aceris]|uniref:Uncharacterized protein n=1 Tax=Pigmentiphaga aceris TaxID=1940612 RepID=A0A5C0AUW6_9BURK|nr:hypothetical protein [Pigmentiphaga aceris]QEI06222.1 hypothetical protein FXN63_10515 [Pigmentiphaga aceris]
MSEKYQFEHTNIGPISAKNITAIITGKFRAKSVDQSGNPSDYEEIIQLIFPNGAVEELPASEENRKYAAALTKDKLNRLKQ